MKSLSERTMPTSVCREVWSYQKAGTWCPWSAGTSVVKRHLFSIGNADPVYGSPTSSRNTSTRMMGNRLTVKRQLWNRHIARLPTRRCRLPVRLCPKLWRTLKCSPAQLVNWYAPSRYIDGCLLTATTVLCAWRWCVTWRLVVLFIWLVGRNKQN